MFARPPQPSGQGKDAICVLCFALDWWKCLGKAQVDELLKKLTADLQDEKLSAARMSSDISFADFVLICVLERKGLLEQLKVLGREPKNSESIFAKEVVSCCCALVWRVTNIKRELKRCVNMASKSPNWMSRRKL